MRTVPLGGKKAAGRVALVDDADYELVTQYRWSVREVIKDGRITVGPYAIADVRRDGSRSTVFMQNLIMGQLGARHLNGHGLDNQRANLQVVTGAQVRASRRPNNGHSSRHKGVAWYPKYGKWQAKITVAGKRRFLGYFTSEDDAGRAYDVAALEAFGEQGRINFPQQEAPECPPEISAGCADWTAQPNARLKHGLYRHPEYQTWLGMMYRCHRPDYYNFPGYGGRGIQVCDEWHDVAMFTAWIDENLGPRPEGHSIDRIDNDGNYEPGNCRWATAKQQRANQRPRTAKRPGGR